MCLLASNGKSNRGLCCVFLRKKGKAARIFKRKTLLDKKWREPREMPVEAKRYQKIQRLETSP